jgi:heat shock protein HslJ/phosphoglycolate phosphatase-like HAD superfamily hydrolase
LAADPLPSWNDGPAKKAITDFIRRVTTEGGSDYVPPAERIAVFDNDGTLWPENPVPFQLAFIFDELDRLAPQHPEWKEDPVVRAALAHDVAALHQGGVPGLLKLAGLTHAGMTTGEFNRRVEAWLATARHPRFKRPYTELTYQPMLELLATLRANGFKKHIVSGGGADFMRVWSESVYGIPPEQVVGSTARTTFELRDSGPVLVKTLEYIFVDDKAGKPVAIHQFIGRRPIACFGNSDGDHAMLQYTTIGNPRPSFGLIVHHTDADREYAYDKAPKSSGKLIEALADAPQQGWTVVDMAKDWNRVFADERPVNSGRSLYDHPWLAEDIAGRGVVDRAQTTIEFKADGSVSGSTGVNRFQGQAKIDGDRLTMGPLATTRRAGPPALMDQESRFLKTIDRVRRFRMEPTGLLYLLNETGEELLRMAPLDPPISK